MKALLLAALPALLWGQEAAGPQPEPRRIEVAVEAPDMVFRFTPRVVIPGMPRVALALSGGGARGLAHIGVLQRLEEVGYPLDSVTGTSAGALVAALHASGFSATEVEDLFRRLDLTRAFLEPHLRDPGQTLQEQEETGGTFLSVERQNGRMTLGQGLRSGAEIQHTLQGLLARGAFFSCGDFDRLQRPLRVLATNLETGQGRVFRQGDLVEAVRASMSIPGGFQPVVIDGQQYVDGALVENLPVTTAREAFHPDLVIAVDASAPLEVRPATSIFSVAARSLDLVVERRQWESRAAADFLIRPEIQATPFLDYGAMGPLLIHRGREAFEARKDAMNALIRDRLTQEQVPFAGLAWDAPGGPPPAVVDLAAQVLRAEAGRLRVQDVQILLQQVLVHGHAREAWATLEPAGIVAVHLRPYRPVASLDVQCPAEWQDKVWAAAKAALPEGEPFNPETFGRLMGQLVYRLLMEGRPLVDARGSGFLEDSGTVRIVLVEPRVTHVDLRPLPGREVDEAHLRRILGPLTQKPFRPLELQQRIALAEHRLHLAEVRFQVRPEEPGGATITLVPVPERRERLDLSLGYETTLGGQLGLGFKALDLGFQGAELELDAARNRLQERARVALRSPFGFSRGAGLELGGAYWRQRLEIPLPWPAPELPGGGEGGAIGVSDAYLQTYFRFGGLGTGKVALEASRREAAYRDGPLRQVRIQDAGFLSAEWDSLDRHTLPREGLLVRARFGAGHAAGAGPQLAPGAFTQAYARVRGLMLFTENTGADLDLEWGQGRNLPLDRWWVLGGPSFVIGSRAVGFLAPEFAAVRLGFPVRVYLGLGLTVELSPRVDAAWVARDTAAFLTSGPAAPRALGAGLVLRTALSNVYVELAYGTLKVQDPPPGSGRAAGGFNFVVGTQPFDLWRRH